MAIPTQGGRLAAQIIIIDHIVDRQGGKGPDDWAAVRLQYGDHRLQEGVHGLPYGAFVFFLYCLKTNSSYLCKYIDGVIKAPKSFVKMKSSGIFNNTT